MVVLTFIVLQSHHRKRRGYALLNLSNQLSEQSETALLRAWHNAMDQDTTISFTIGCDHSSEPISAPYAKPIDGTRQGHSDDLRQFVFGGIEHNKSH